MNRNTKMERIKINKIIVNYVTPVLIKKSYFIDLLDSR